MIEHSGTGGIKSSPLLKADGDSVRINPGYLYAVYNLKR